jgi:hypothetical protein
VNGRQDGGRGGWSGGRGRRRGTSAPDDFHDQILLVGIQAAQLIFQVQTCLTTHIQQVLTFHVQFTSQGVYANFILLQTGLLR